VKQLKISCDPEESPVESDTGEEILKGRDVVPFQMIGIKENL